MMNRTKFLPTLIATATMLFATAAKVEAISFTGTSSASISLPEGTYGAYLSNEDGGTNNRMTWGTPLGESFTNYIQYDGLGFSTDLDTLFAVGNITFRNGTTKSNSHNFTGYLPLDVKLSFTNPLVGDEQFQYTFNYKETRNTGDPVLDADILTFPTDDFTSGTFNFDGVDYTLMLMGFSSDGGETPVIEFDSPEETTAKAMLYAKIIREQRTKKGTPGYSRLQDIPEPTIIAGLGLVGVYLAGSFKKRC